MGKIDGLTPQIIGMIDELMEHSWRMKDHSVNAGRTDEYGFPFEPDHVISADPLGFYESGMRLQTQATELFRFVYSLNRHSPLFAKASSLLEKLVRQLGICCITKAVLEQDGSHFEMLDDLTVGWLRSITAFNVRKCYSAFMEDRELNVFNGSVMDTCRIKWWNSHLSQVKRKAMYEYNCPTCGKKFFAYGNRNRKYCSHQCYITARFGTPVCG